MTVLNLPTNPYNSTVATTLPMLREAAKSYAKINLSGKTVKNNHSGDITIITMGGVKHTVHGASDPLLRALSILPEILTLAEKTGAVTDKLGRPDILMVHKYELLVLDGTRELIALVVVRESSNRSRNFYDLAFLAR